MRQIIYHEVRSVECSDPDADYSVAKFLNEKDMQKAFEVLSKELEDANNYMEEVDNYRVPGYLSEKDQKKYWDIYNKFAAVKYYTRSCAEDVYESYQEYINNNK